jgi:hypothetical protein
MAKRGVRVMRTRLLQESHPVRYRTMTAAQSRKPCIETGSGERIRLVPPGETTEDPFVQLAGKLGELEIVIGPKARPAVNRVRAGLREAIAMRERGDVPGAIAAIRAAMERLAALGAELDREEGTAMREIAAQFIQALGAGAKGGAKSAAATMRQKAGDTGGGDRNDW